eukprot:6207737-Prorocentrum_lima.AAC.1
MTSSLVGSEMCIRDRHKCGNILLNDDPISWDEACHPTLLTAPIMFFTIDAVSYTHLTLPTICSV